jgi:hypothetical protein
MRQDARSSGMTKSPSVSPCFKYSLFGYVLLTLFVRQRVVDTWWLFFFFCPEWLEVSFTS